MASTLPSTVTALVHNFDAWIVGSAADPTVSTPRDYDVVVPFYKWGQAAYFIPKNARVNTFGGFKFTDTMPDGVAVEVDVWPGDLGWIMRQSKTKWAWQPPAGVRLQVIRDT